MAQNHPPPNGNNGPQGGHFQIYPPPGPPRVALPVDLRGGPAFQVSDVREDLMSESDMREELSEYVIIRFEKMADKDRVDDYGRPKWPSWVQAIRTEDWSIPKDEAIRKIRQLNHMSRSVVDKKNSLTSPLKRQIDKTQQDLMRQEPDVANYHWVLIQLDHQLRPIELPFSSAMVAGTGHALKVHRSGHGHRSTSHRISSKRSHPRGSSHYPKNRAYERVSLTAYFKRTPRPEVDIARLWELKKNLNGTFNGTYRPAHSNNVIFQIPPQQQQQQKQQPQQQQQQQRQQQQQQQQKPQQPPQQTGKAPIPPPPRPPNQNPQGAHPHGQAHGHSQGRQSPHPNGPIKHGGHGHHQGDGRNVKQRSDSSSDSEDDSRSSRRSYSSHTYNTAPSSISDGRGHKITPHRVHRRRHGEPKGVFVVSDSPRLPHPPPSPHYPLRMPVPPYPVSYEGGSVASAIERVRETAYDRGHFDGQAYAKARGRPRPHIVQERSPTPRRLYRRRGDDADETRRVFSRLSVYDRDDDDDDDSIEYRRDSREEARRRREFERRLQRGSVMEDDDFASPPSLSSYGYSTDGRGYRRAESPYRRPRVRRVVSYY